MSGLAGRIARRLADESFRHSWDMSDERLIGGAWVAGLCCECGEFVPFGQEVDHVATAFAPLIREAQEEASGALIARNLAVLKHEAETPMRGHDEDGACCRRVLSGASQ